MEVVIKGGRTYGTMGHGQKGREEGLEALKEGVAVFMAEAGKKSKILKKKVELSSVQNDVRKAFTRLGSKVYDIHTQGEQEVFGKTEVKDFITQIDGFKARVKEIETEIEVIRREEDTKTSSTKSEKKELPPPGKPMN
jgi:hypothetical protein